jgi:hypothetical protein
MNTQLTQPVRYSLDVGEGQTLDLNALLGKSVTLHYTGQIFCVHCQKKTSKSFNQGYCYPCFIKLAQCDMCIMKPETCHYQQGTCREPDWALQFCFQPHIVYLANSSGIKVGITRQTQLPTRWIDQGAVQALPIIQARSRYISGLAEVTLAAHVSDKTSWQKMLKGSPDAIDLSHYRDELLGQCAKELADINQLDGGNALAYLPDAQAVNIEFPVLNYPAKVKSFNLDNTSQISGVLLGIKGQYLLFDTGVINIRKFAGYEVEWQV